MVSGRSTGLTSASTDSTTAGFTARMRTSEAAATSAAQSIDFAPTSVQTRSSLFRPRLKAQSG